MYVISKPVSFGEGVVKIGMTRRADLNDRVKELGDASIPELFDVHVFSFTDNAPALEKYLHGKFSEQRVNLVNNRKEFFIVAPNEVISELSNLMVLMSYSYAKAQLKITICDSLSFDKLPQHRKQPPAMPEVLELQYTRTIVW